MASKKKVVGVIMTYNCSTMVEGLLKHIPAGYVDELIIVDDNSRDQEQMRAIATQHNIPFFPHGHLGYGGNLKFGLQKALERGADYAIELHGDGQFDPSVIPAALEKMNAGADFVMGSRFTDFRQPLRDGMSFARYFANIMLSFFDRLILQIPWTEFHGGFRAYSKKLIKTVGTTKGSNNHLFSFQIISMARFYNLNFAEIPVRANYHGEHTSISIPESAVYFFRTFSVLTQYLLARIGIKSKLFK